MALADPPGSSPWPTQWAQVPPPRPRRGPHAALIVAVGGALVVVVGVGAYLLTRSDSCSVEPEADLAECDLTGEVLAGEDLSEADLTAAVLSGADLSGVDLTDAVLADADLSETDLSGAVLAGADLSGADLGDADLSSATLTDATVDDASFAGADLSDTDLAAVDLSGASFGGARFGGADVSNANLGGLDLSGVDLARADLHSSDLTGTVLAEAILTDAFLDNAVLAGADLSGAQLQGVGSASTAIFDGANLSGADLTGVDLEAARLAGVAFASANLGGADLSNADLTGADLSGADLRGATLLNAVLDGALLGAAFLNATDFTGATGISDDMLVAALGVPVEALALETAARSIRFDAAEAMTLAGEGVRDGTPVAGARGFDGSPAFHPALVVGPTAGAFTPSWSDFVRDDWAPTGLRFLELVVVERETAWETLEVCEYVSNGAPAPPITRYRPSVTVHVLAASDGRIVGERTFVGTSPRECTASEPFNLTELRGDPPNLGTDAVAWLTADFVHPPAA